MPNKLPPHQESSMIKELIEAYQSTSFNVFEPELTIRIGHKNQLLDDLLQQHQCEKWAYITAWNPFSENQSDEINQLRNKELKEDLQDYILFDGEGVGQDPKWKPEQSFLVLGISREKAIALGNKFKQHAIVFGEINQVPELLWLS